MIYCLSCGHVAHTRRAHFMDDGTKIMIAQCRNIYCSATFEASESFFSDSKDSGMEYISGKQRYRDSLTSASGSMKRPKRMLVTGYCCRRCKGLALSRTSRRLSQEVTERFYVCTDPGCGLVFKTLQTINRFIVRPVTPDELAESLHEKQELPPVRLKTQSYSLRLE
ncbi:ogr/Delta-like zinc finger family protein [Escherichia coli]|uniref:ogr/Delta-like zinc finger family protein n=1 Tax=Escherichia albertii TaxID=208962 RepID=UPI0021D499E1|nr:ogr/Delta-like zinc finger family protein [Escherichia albertii]MCU7296074.1 ogr/Delta-like zinc finger family protein [Escherichia albertii]